MLDIDGAIKAFKKLDKGKIVLIVVIAGVAVYVMLVAQRSVVQRTMKDVTQGYIENIPGGLCIENVKASHQVFPPRYGIEVDYVPCIKK